MTPLRDRMSAALMSSMKARDPVAIAALRSALARVANAEAVPIDTTPRAGALHEAPVGAGAADAPRRELTEADVRAVVEAEVAEHERSARHLADAGRPEDAARVTAEASVLRSLLAE
ncbi:MAG TPA: hypothetical protein VES93_01140 [Ornithinibacter sp.]|nr:hypothetical protein [Ornithinibacter sp.]